MPEYFAYGSNLCRARMLERVPDSVLIAVGSLADHRISFDKRGADGTGKANIEACRDGRVWGAIYRVSPRGLDALDQFERGYRRTSVSVTAKGGDVCTCVTYIAERAADGLLVGDWYMRLVIGGARELELPEAYLAELEQRLAAARLPSSPRDR